MKTSKLWDGLAKDKFSKIDEEFISSFREPGNANNRLAAWDPFDRSMRYFKFLFFHQLQTKDAAFFANYSRLGITSLGNPVTLKAAELEINLDHFFSVEEYTFLSAHLDLDRASRIVEIGAGFGRTAQALIKLVGKIERYTIIDIPEVLQLSSSYLERVLTRDEFAKLEFVNALQLPSSGREFHSVDVVINIDSFQEMPPDTVKYYLDSVVANAQYFYSKNAVGKYRPESVGLFNIDEHHLQDVFSLGLSTDVIDIFNEKELIAARRKHVEQYRPAEQFSLVAQEPLGIFPYYLSVLYANGRWVSDK